jgi:hypothetical protein
MSNTQPVPPTSVPPPGARAPKAAVPADQFAAAKANLRDTIKWLATTFASVAAIILAGTSLTGVSQLKGASMSAALIGGGIGLLCFVIAAGLMLRLLTSKTFFISDINSPEYTQLKATLNAHAVDILPAEIRSIDEMLTLRQAATEQARQYSSSSQSSQYTSASDFLTDIVDSLSRLTNLAHFEILRANLNAAVPKLFILAIGALIGLGVFAVFSGNGKTGKDNTPDVGNKPVACTPASCEDGPTVPLVTGAGWSAIGTQYAAVCGEAPIKVQLLGNSQSGWIRVRLLAPEACAGIVLPLPIGTVIPTATAPK